MKEAINRKKLAVMFAVSYLAYSVIYVARLNFSAAASVMETAGSLSNAQIGIIGSAFSLVYALGKVPNGYIGDRLNTRLTVTVGLCIAGVSNIVIGLVPVFPVIVVFWALNAYGQSMLWGPLLRGFSDNYPSEINSRLTPYFASSIGVGSVVGLLIAMLLSEQGGIRACFIIPGVVCLAAALFVVLFLKGSPGKKSAENESFFKVIVTFIRDGKFRRMMLPALLHGMVKDNVSVWMVVFFVTVYGVNISEVTAYVFFIPLCTLVGRLLYPPLYRLLGRAHKLSALSLGLTALLAAVLCIPGVPMWCAAACLGTISALASVINTHFVTLFPQEYAGKNLCFAASTMDLLVYGGAAVGSAVYGFAIEWAGFSAMFIIWLACSAACIPLVLRCAARDKQTNN